ncbi:hypothetical protein J4402_04370 [Candidatus Pacearchaeota archaeon]|nr:hypothetical protein [Candidatus Pacearchaeota archaeon]
MPSLPAGVYRVKDLKNDPERRDRYLEIVRRMRAKAEEDAERIRLERLEAERIVMQLRLFRPICPRRYTE